MRQYPLRYQAAISFRVANSDISDDDDVCLDDSVCATNQLGDGIV